MLAINQHISLISVLNLMYMVSFERDVNAAYKSVAGGSFPIPLPLLCYLLPKLLHSIPWLGQSISSSSLSSKETQRRNEFNPRKGKTLSPYQNGPVSQQGQQNYDWTARFKQYRICHVLEFITYDEEEKLVLSIKHFFTSQTIQHKTKKSTSAEAEEPEVFSGSHLPSQQSRFKKHQQNNRWV